MLTAAKFWQSSIGKHILLGPVLCGKNSYFSILTSDQISLKKIVFRWLDFFYMFSMKIFEWIIFSKSICKTFSKVSGALNHMHKYVWQVRSSTKIKKYLQTIKLSFTHRFVLLLKLKNKYKFNTVYKRLEEVSKGGNTRYFLF